MPAPTRKARLDSDGVVAALCLLVIASCCACPEFQGHDIKRRRGQQVKYGGQEDSARCVCGKRCARGEQTNSSTSDWGSDGGAKYGGASWDGPVRSRSCRSPLQGHAERVSVAEPSCEIRRNGTEGGRLTKPSRSRAGERTGNLACFTSLHRSAKTTKGSSHRTGSIVWPKRQREASRRPPRSQCLTKSANSNTAHECNH